MGNRDVEVLLAVKSGDTIKYQRLWDRLTQYADSLALALFSSPTLRDDAVEKAMDKAGDWLKSDGIQYVEHPWAYAKKTIFNSLRDSNKTRRLEEVDITAVRDTTDRTILSWTADEIRKEFIKADDDMEDDDQGSGWQVFQIIDQGKPRRKDDDSYHPHRWLEALRELLKYTWWWGMDNWDQKVKSDRSRAMQSLRGAYEEAYSRYEEYTGKLWSNYHLIMALADNIQRTSEKRIMKAYLAGLKQVEIAKDFGVSPAFVSRVVSKHLQEWEWGDPDIYKARLILLTQHLAVLYRNFTEDLAKAESEYWAGSPIVQRYMSLSPTVPVSSSPISYIRAYHEENLYGKVVNSIEAKTYFGDLEKGDIIALGDICSRFYSRWYGILHYTLTH